MLCKVCVFIRTGTNTHRESRLGCGKISNRKHVLTGDGLATYIQGEMKSCVGALGAFSLLGKTNTLAEKISPHPPPLLFLPPAPLQTPSLPHAPHAAPAPPLPAVPGPPSKKGADGRATMGWAKKRSAARAQSSPASSAPHPSSCSSSLLAASPFSSPTLATDRGPPSRSGRTFGTDMLLLVIAINLRYLE